ncbi:hypothetical protein QUF90_18295 [Desulfococcaceae bacterium HSG9]|nr:hypothetical protein [Desulfococcaceae bacterium HSG9]
MSAKEKLEKVYNQYISVVKIYRSAKNRTQRDKSFAMEKGKILAKNLYSK